MRGISRIIEDHPDLELVGSAQDGKQALSDIVRIEPDVAVLDVSMPSTSGLQILAALRSLDLITRVLLLTGTESRRTIAAAIANGASGYLLKTVDWDDLVNAIIQVGNGEKVFAPEVEEIVRAQTEHPILTEREREVLRGLAKDLTVTRIAEDLNIERNTVRTHLKRVYVRLGVSSQAAAVAKAMRLGLIE